MNITKNYRIVLTGGPGGGKTTALDLFRREFPKQLAVVPEAATMLFSSGIARSDNADVTFAIQKTIYQLQKNIEDVQLAKHPDRVLLCDRGTLDGAAYCPDDAYDFFTKLGSSYEQELLRYDAVIFFETAAKNGYSIRSNNLVRTESQKEAIELDQRLQDVWSKHPNYHFIPSTESFLKKIMGGIITINQVIKTGMAK